MAQSLIDFANQTSPNRGRTCVVCSLPPDIQSEISGAAGKGIGSRITSQWLTTLGHTISRHQLDRHRADGHKA